MSSESDWKTAKKEADNVIVQQIEITWKFIEHNKNLLLNQFLDKSQIDQKGNIKNKGAFDDKTEEATDYVNKLDTKEATDYAFNFVNLNNKELAQINFSYRVRFESKGKQIYWHMYKDISIRSSRDTGTKTELSKILSGHCDFMLYTWADKCTHDIKNYIIIDLKAFRLAYPSAKVKEIPNGDGTYFRIFEIQWLYKTNCISYCDEEIKVWLDTLS